MAAYNKFEGFVGYLGKAAVNMDTDQIDVYLTSATPSASADDVFADLAEIATGNGYAGPSDIQNAYTETGGTGTLSATDVTITASGGTVGGFQYAVLFDNTHASDVLMGWYDYGSNITLADGESFTVDFGASVWTLT